MPLVDLNTPRYIVTDSLGDGVPVAQPSPHVWHPVARAGSFLRGQAVVRCLKDGASITEPVKSLRRITVTSSLHDLGYALPPHVREAVATEWATGVADRHLAALVYCALDESAAAYLCRQLNHESLRAGHHGCAKADAITTSMSREPFWRSNVPQLLAFARRMPCKCHELGSFAQVVTPRRRAA
jgi:hypothetical protein